jgi:hypothetical protein
VGLGAATGDGRRVFRILQLLQIRDGRDHWDLRCVDPRAGTYEVVDVLRRRQAFNRRRKLQAAAVAKAFGELNEIVVSAIVEGRDAQEIVEALPGDWPYFVEWFDTCDRPVVESLVWEVAWGYFAQEQLMGEPRATAAWRLVARVVRELAADVPEAWPFHVMPISGMSTAKGLMCLIAARPNALTAEEAVVGTCCVADATGLGDGSCRAELTDDGKFCITAD